MTGVARPDAVLIAGPTASGKSAVAMAIAERTGGVIVNADSMQVYDGLGILTARPGDDELAVVEHRLYGYVPPQRAHSVGRWLRDAAGVIADLKARNALPVIVGGTGLYFRALLEGIAEIPEPDPAIRTAWRDRARAEPWVLHEELARRDPAGAATLRPTDTQRLVRALEVFDTTGEPVARWQNKATPRPLLVAEGTRRIVLEPPRDQLRRTIDRRFEAMLAAGAIDEVAALLALRLDSALPVMKAIGVREIGEYLGGRLTLEEAADRAKAATRQYAKRQTTWFRNQFGTGWERHASPDSAASRKTVNLP